MRRRPNTVSISIADRGQTTQDFTVGIGIFLLTIAFVFTFVPTVITPFSASLSAEASQAERIGTEVVDNLSEGPNELDGEAFERTYTDENLTSEFGLRSTDNVHVSVVTFGDETTDEKPIEVGDTSLEGGDTYNDETAATVTRLVTVVDEDGAQATNEEEEPCDPACKLVVRVW